MNVNQFANCFGFKDYEQMLNNTSTVFQDTDISWNVTKLRAKNYIAWDSNEIGDDRVESFSSQEEAENYLSLLRQRNHLNLK